MAGIGLDVIMRADDSYSLPLYAEHGSGLALIGQRIRARALTLRGDNPLRVTDGIDWLAHLTARPPDPDALLADLALAWRGIPGVQQVTDLSAEVSSTDQAQITVTATVRTQYGDVPVTVSSSDESGTRSITLGGVLGHSRRIVL